jgi:RNA polymerase subunit RPABC4/transcription elongation factor Spt4
MLDTEVLFNILKVAALFIGLSFIVFWVGLVWWVSQDIVTRTSDKIIIAAAVAMTAILGPVGVMFYLIIRPKQTMKESYGEMMEHEMMLRAAASTICPMCEHMTQEDFVNCPYCGTVLKKQCANCQKLVDMEWSYCPYCGQVAEKPTTQSIAQPTITLEPSTIQELQSNQGLEQIKSSKLEEVRLDQAQKAAFSTSIGLTSQHKEKLTNAGQSALSLLKQTFSASSRPVATNLESASNSEKLDNNSSAASAQGDANKADTVTPVKAQSKKRTVKGRANRRAKK